MASGQWTPGNEHFRKLRKELMSSKLRLQFSRAVLGFVDQPMKVRIEEKQVVVLAVIRLWQTLHVIILQEIVNRLYRSQVSVRGSLLMAPETGLPRLQFNLKQGWWE